jgi:hypothetical protein
MVSCDSCMWGKWPEGDETECCVSMALARGLTFPSRREAATTPCPVWSSDQMTGNSHTTIEETDARLDKRVVVLLARRGADANRLPLN